MAEEDFGKTSYFGGPGEYAPDPTLNITPPLDYSSFNFGVQGAPGVSYSPADLQDFSQQRFSTERFNPVTGGANALLGQMAPYAYAKAFPSASINEAVERPIAPALGGAAGVAPTDRQAPEQGGFLDKLREADKFLKENQLLARLLGGVGTAGLGAIMGGRGQQAATRVQQDLSKLGATQRAEGQRLVAAAQRGELTAPQMQQLEAFRAQQAQALAGRGLTGGTAEQQLQGQIENMRQQMLAQNLQQGLALLQIGDQYTQQAVTAGYNASQNAQNAANNFYMQALRTFAGQSNQVPYTIVPATQAPAAPAPAPL